MIRTMIFDLDGTLVQTERLKAQSYAKAAVELRAELAEADVVAAFKDVVGLARREVAQTLLDRFDLADAASARQNEFGVQTPWQAYVQVRMGIYNEMLADPNIIRDNQWPHNVKLLDRAHGHCDKVGLATMSQCEQANQVLAILGLRDRFDFVATRDDVEAGKPDPEIYRLVASELGMPPTACLVIEDSPSGVKAAVAAGMACIAVSTPFTREGLYEADVLDAAWIVDDHDQLFAVVDRMLAQHGGNGAV